MEIKIDAQGTPLVVINKEMPVRDYIALELAKQVDVLTNSNFPDEIQKALAIKELLEALKRVYY